VKGGLWGERLPAPGVVKGSRKTYFFGLLGFHGRRPKRRGLGGGPAVVAGWAAEGEAAWEHRRPDGVDNHWVVGGGGVKRGGTMARKVRGGGGRGARVGAGARRRHKGGGARWWAAWIFTRWMQLRSPSLLRSIGREIRAIGCTA